MRLAAACEGQRRELRDPETCAIEPLDPERQDVAVEPERQHSKGGGGHRRAAKERHRNAVIHLLVREQCQMRAAAQRRDRAPRAYGALRNEFAAVAAEPRDHAVDQRIVGGAVDLGDRDPVLDAGKHADLPIRDMAGEEDHPPPAPTARSTCSKPCVSTGPPGSKTLIFRRCGYSATTRPRLSHMPATNARDFGLGKLGKSAADVAPSMFGDAER